MNNDNLIKTISEIFMSTGIKSVTMDDLAKRLKMSKRTLYELYGTKNNLITKIVTKQIEEESRIIKYFIENSKNSIDVLVKISKTMIEMHSNVHNSVLIDIKKHYTEAWNLINNFHFSFIRKVVANNLERGISEGVYRGDIKPEILASFYIIQLQLFSDQSIFNLEKTKYSELITQFFDYHIYGILSSKGIEYFLNLKKSNK